VSAKRAATKSSASSQLARRRISPRAARISGWRARAAIAPGDIVRGSVVPLLHSRPRFEGWSGSPRTPTTRPASEVTITPHPVPQ
jgi:hypothetical protein